MAKPIGGGAADDARDGFREGLNPSYRASAAKAPGNVLHLFCCAWIRSIVGFRTKRIHA